VKLTAQKETTLNAKDTLFHKKNTLNCKGKILSLSSPRVMGILNVTPDSFYQGSRSASPAEVLRRADTMLQEGACLLDVGGYSSRPGAEDVPYEEERERVIPAIKSILREFPEAIVSVDTFRARIAEEAIEHGATVINDISGGELDAEMVATAGRLKVPYILMHMRGTPQSMTKLTDYDDLVLELINYFEEKVTALYAAGVTDIVLDPGFGFAKTVDQSFKVLSRLADFKVLDLPLLVGLSRKSMVYRPAHTDASGSLTGTICLNTIALMKGADILRVHDVKEAVQTVQLFKKTVSG
jgi:dihydropteroate synthase